MRLGRLFGPEIRPTNLYEITSVEEYEATLTQELTVLFKHSHRCSVSQAVYRTVTRFCSAAPERSVSLVSVQASRKVAVFIEKHTGIRHESPQIIALRNGVVFADASHWRITPAFLETLFSE